MSNILAVIPVLETNETIPKMYSRFLIEKPLVLYLTENAKNTSLINEIYIITDDENIAHICELRKLKFIYLTDVNKNRDNEFNRLLIENWKEIEDKEKKKFEFLTILNPNCPFIKSETIEQALVEVKSSKAEMGISVKFSNDIFNSFWREDNNGYGIKTFGYNSKKFRGERFFRQINGILILKTSFAHKIISNDISKVKLIKLNFPESLEINSHFDWWIAEKFLKRKKILLRTDGYNEIGLGHVYRTLSLAHQLIDHEIIFVSKREYELGINLIKEYNYSLKTFSSQEEFNKILQDYKPNILINDILDTNREYILDLKSRDIFVVNFEDLGPGTIEANIVINALFKRRNFYENHYWGKDYYILREEFFLVDKKKIKQKVENILITFGGTDPNNYTERVLNILNRMNLKDIKVNVILGLGYKNPEQLKERVKEFKLQLTIKQHVKNISKYMHEADIAISPAGRTIYELASIGVPTIVLIENEPGLLHTFADEKNGIINLGLGYEIPDKKIRDAIENLINDFELRKSCNKLMLNYNLKSGINNVLSLIFSKYEQYERECL